MTRTISIKKFIGIGLLGALFAFIIIYTVIETKALARGVELKIAGISDGEVFEKDILAITGQAENANHITIDGREIKVDKDKRFTQELILSPGLNIITVEAQDKFKKKTNNTYRVFYKEQTVKATALNN